MGISRSDHLPFFNFLMFLLQITRDKTYGIIVSIAVHVRDTRSPSPLPPQSLTLLGDTCHVGVSWALIGCYDNPRDSLQQITGHMQTVLHAQSEGETPESHFGNSVYIYIVCVCLGVYPSWVGSDKICKICKIRICTCKCITLSLKPPEFHDFFFLTLFPFTRLQHYHTS